MKYLVYYDTPDNLAENRNYVLSAAEKIDYICSVLNRIGHSVELISASASRNRRGCRGKKVQLSDRTSLKLFSCIGTGILPKRLLGRLLFNTRLFLYLIFHIQKNETVLVYHSLGYAGMVALLKKCKGFQLILEVEEIYADVNGRAEDRKKEYTVFSAADGFLFPTQLLNDRINTRNKPWAVAHGSYQAKPDLGCDVFAEDPCKDGKRKIHCVYAGTFDPRKGGTMAAAAAEFLPEQYHVHILGFGTKEQTEQITALINRISSVSRCMVTYDGLLSGEDYIKFLQSCDIGLSTQNPDASFNETSFPSKILSYLANGLQVVTTRIPAVEASAIGRHVHYYDRQTPESIAEAILRVKLDDSPDIREILRTLDLKFENELKILLTEHLDRNGNSRRMGAYEGENGGLADKI